MSFFFTTSRLWIQAWHNVSRNFWLSLATAIVGVMALLSVNILVTVSAISQQTLADLRERVNLVLYFKPDVAAERVRSLGLELARHAFVQQVRFISPEVALQRFTERHQDSPEIMEGLSVVGGNPFGSSLIVQARSERDYQPLLAVIRDEPYRSLLQQPDEEFQSYERVIERFTNLTAKAQRVGFAMSALFILIAVLLVFNAVRVAIYTQREEIAIMKLVGAAAWYVRIPFLLAATLYAVGSLLVFLGLWYAFLWAVQPFVASLFSSASFSLVEYFNANSLRIFGPQLIGLILLNILSASLAMRRHLRV